MQTEWDYIIFDTDLPGLGIRILPSGKRSYLVQYRVDRSFRRMSLALHGVLTTEKARTEAIKVPRHSRNIPVLPALSR